MVRPALLSLIIALAGAPTVAFSQTKSVVIETTPPCVDPSTGICLNFISGAFDVQTFKARASAPGKALVSIDGTAQCSNKSSSSGPSLGVADFSGQIIDDNSSADPTGPGGQRFSFRLNPVASAGSDVSQTVNLATRRVFDVAKGRTTFSYRIKVNRMDQNVSCTIFNAYMTVIFTPL